MSHWPSDRRHTDTNPQHGPIPPVKHAWIVTIAMSILIAACGAEDPPLAPTIAPTASTNDAPSPTDVVPTNPSTAPTVGPTPTPVSGIAIGSLPRPRFDPARLTVVCGRDRTSLDHGPPQPSIVCGTTRRNALAVGLASIEMVAVEPIVRLYLQGNTCPTSGCEDGAFQVATVVGWSSNGDAYRTVIDLRVSRVSIPIRDDSFEWPTFGPSQAPAVQRPTIRNALVEITTRTPYPFCGRAKLGKPRGVARCFRDAVLAGRRVEMILHTTGAEGFPMLELYRFSGKGAVVRYRHAEGRWSRAAGSLSLMGPPSVWYMDQWDRTVKQLA